MIKNIVIGILLALLAFPLVSKYFVKPDQITVVEEQTQTTPAESSEETEPTTTMPIIKGKSRDLSNQGLKKLPESVLKETSLESLNISNNSLTGALPAEIRFLKNLKVLNASNNQMTGVPAEVGQLEKLEILDLSNNQLTGLPYELGNLKNLKTLNLSGNDYSKQDLEVIKQGLPKDIQIIL